MGGFSKSIMSYKDCRALLDRALESERGLKVSVGTYGEAVRLRSRIHNFRRMDARENSRVHPSDHPLHNASVYDELVIMIPNKGPDVHILKSEAQNDMRRIEDL